MCKFVDGRKYCIIRTLLAIGMEASISTLDFTDKHSYWHNSDTCDVTYSRSISKHTQIVSLKVRKPLPIFRFAGKWMGFYGFGVCKYDARIWTVNCKL